MVGDESRARCVACLVGGQKLATAGQPRAAGAPKAGTACVSMQGHGNPRRTGVVAAATLSSCRVRFCDALDPLSVSWVIISSQRIPRSIFAPYYFIQLHDPTLNTPPYRIRTVCPSREQSSQTGPAAHTLQPVGYWPAQMPAEPAGVHNLVDKLIIRGVSDSTGP